MNVADSKAASASNVNQLANLSQSDFSSRAESDKLRRESMEKKAQIDLLEREASHVSEIKNFLMGIIEDFQATGKFQFYDVQNDSLEDLLKNPKNGIDILRKGINGLISKHQNLSSRFESEMNKNLIQLQSDLNEAKRANEKESEKLALARQ